MPLARYLRLDIFEHCCLAKYKVKILHIVSVHVPIDFAVSCEENIHFDTETSNVKNRMKIKDEYQRRHDNCEEMISTCFSRF